MVDINITNDDQNINDYLFIYKSTGLRPNKILVHDFFSEKSFWEVIKKFDFTFEIESQYEEIVPGDVEFDGHERYFIKFSKDFDFWISFWKMKIEDDNYTISDICFYYVNIPNRKEIQNIISELGKSISSYEEEYITPINALTFHSSGFDVEPVFSKYELGNYYSKKTSKEISKLIKSLKKENNGIISIKGQKGLGKTTASKIIASSVDKFSIFIPINMIDLSINNPEFRSYLKRFNKCMIILDDFESLPHSLSMQTFSNMIQLVEGFSSDSMDIVFVIISNTITSIDHLIKGSNSFISEIEFELLSEKESKNLSKNLGNEFKFEGNNRLIDVIKNRKGQASTLGLK